MLTRCDIKVLKLKHVLVKFVELYPHLEKKENDKSSVEKKIKCFLYFLSKNQIQR